MILAVRCPLRNEHANSQFLRPKYQYRIFNIKAVIDALTGIADRDENGFIESDELAQYVEAAIPMIAKHAFNRRQTPYIAVWW